MIWDWSAAHTAATVTHTIVPHITAYPDGSSVTNNETVLATATLPNNVTASSTIVVSGFTMTYPSIWAQYSSFYSGDCAVSTSTDVIPEFTQTLTQIGDEPSWTSTEVYPERTQLYTIQTGKHVTMPATADPARFFYRAEGWNYDGNSPATVTPPMLEYLAGLQTVWEQMSGQDVRTCIFPTCAPTAVGHKMVSATVLVESTQVASAVYYNAPTTSDGIPALPSSTPETTSPTTPPPPPPVSTPENTPPTGQQPPSQVPDTPEAPAPTQSSVEVVIISTGGSDEAIATITTAVAGGNQAVPETTFVRTTTIDGQAQEQTVVSPVPVATPPGEVTLIREVTSNGQALTETIVSVSAAQTSKASEETIVTTITGSDGALATQSIISIRPGVGPQPSEATLVRTATLDGTPVAQTIVSISAANQGGNDSGDRITGAPGTPAQETVTRTIVSDGQTYVQTLISPVETGSLPGETTSVRTTTSDGTTLVQTVVSQLPSGGAGGNAGGQGSTTSATSGSAYSGPAVVSEGPALNAFAGKGLAVMAVVVAAGLLFGL
ncbi:hypothetical protein INS49_006229 [Diaporthe citri]|uniref:uncharacterized protein n=1 Tax=Diaporthe citri TaxID=83186 RepID=UPI001C7F87E3|nr:uncharacterized protein INS49_006229 [Diaporthe citri]KAG6364626.1 hypothetical protein INS49_006229 [Diaporthe citri]